MDEPLPAIDRLPKRVLGARQRPALPAAGRRPARAHCQRLVSGRRRTAQGSDHRGAFRGQPDHRPAGAARSRGRWPDQEALGQAGRGHRAQSLGQSQLEVQEFRRHGGVHASDAQLKIKSYRREKAAPLQRHFGMAKDEAGYCLRSVLAGGRPEEGADHHLFPARRRRTPQARRFHRRADLPLGAEAARRPPGRCRMSPCGPRSPTRPSPPTSRSTRARRSSPSRCSISRPTMRNIEFSIARHPADLFSITYDAPNDLA